MTRFEQRVLTGPRVAVPGGALADEAGPPVPAPVVVVDDAEFLAFDLDDVVDTLVAVFRSHPHIGNVMTHICRGRWVDVAHALRTILDPHSTHHDLSSLADNILELLWAERGTTGRILKPRFCDLLEKLTPSIAASQLFAHVEGLLLERRAPRYAPDGQRADVPDGELPTMDGEPQCAMQATSTTNVSSTCVS